MVNKVIILIIITQDKMPHTNHSGIRQQLLELEKANDRLREVNSRQQEEIARLKDVQDQLHQRDALRVRLRYMLILMQRFRTMIHAPCQLIEATTGTPVTIRMNLFGSCMTALLCNHFKGIPGDCDVSIRVEGVPDSVAFTIGLLRFMESIGSEHLRIEVRNIRRTYSGVENLDVMTVKLIGQIDSETHSVNVDCVMSPLLPAPDTIATGWEFGEAHNGAFSIRNRAVGTGDMFDACLSLLSNETKWVAPDLNGLDFGSERFKYVFGRLQKIMDRGFIVTNGPHIIEERLDCAVCLSTESTHVVNACGHTQCLSCITKMRDPRCSMCRAPMLPWFLASSELPDVTRRLIADASRDGADGAADGGGSTE